jgi:hypothetical protein
MTTTELSPATAAPSVEPPLSKQAEQVSAAIQREIADLDTAIGTTVLDPLRAALRSAADAHRDLTTAMAAIATRELPHAEHWRAIYDYRRQVADRVLAPLATHLDTRAPGERLIAMIANRVASFAQAADQVAPEETVPEHAGLYASEPGDSVVQRVRKALRRAGRGVTRVGRTATNSVGGVFGRAPREKPVRDRTVPLRALTDHHTQVRLVKALAPRLEAQLQQIAHILGPLEAAVATWANAVSRAEHDADLLEVHQPGWLKFATPATGGDAAAPPPLGNLSDVRATADTLQEALDVAAAHERVGPLLTDELTNELTAAYRWDLERGGTFLVTPSARRVPPSHRSPAAKMRARAADWVTWHTELQNRFALTVQLIELRERLLGLEEQALDRIASATIRPVTDSFASLAQGFRAMGDDTEQVCRDASPHSLAHTAGQLREIQSKALAKVDAALKKLPGTVVSRDVLDAPGQTEWDQLVEVMAGLPDRVSVHLWKVDPDQVVDPRADVFAIDLREIAEDALAPPWPEQFKKRAEPLQVRIAQVWSDAERVRDIIEYNLSSAADELETVAASKPDGEKARASVATALELAPDGVRRAADTLDELTASLAEPWGDLASRAFEAVREDWEDLLRRVRAEQTIEGLWVRVHTRAARQLERARWRAGTWAGRAGTRVLSLAGQAQRLALRLVRRGQTAVGVAAVEEADAFHALDAIIGVSELTENRPLVYRKLFSFAPVTDPSLLEGRARNLVSARNHYKAWREGDSPGVMILTAPLGSGRTSFLNVLERKVFDDCRLSKVVLDDRITDEASAAALLADALGIEGEPRSSLEALETHLVHADRSDPPIVCAIDNLELLMLQSHRGTELLQRVLIFLSRTDSTVYWITTIGRQAWHYLTKTAAAAAQLVTAAPLDRLGRDVLEDIISNRHGRTGLPIMFAPPSGMTPVMRHKLRRARSASKKQAILREWYFDSLHRHSGEDVMLALFYWLRSTDFAGSDDTLTIAPIEPLSFRFLRTFELQRTFTLKAFVVHNSLTPEEHATIFRMTTEQSTVLLESLLTLRLIEPMPSDSQPIDTSARQPVTPGRRYRLRRLILHPVLEHLKGRNLVA